MQGEKSRLKTEVSFPVELLEELTRAVLSGEKFPLRDYFWRDTLGPIGGQLQSLDLVKSSQNSI